jgi:hypothetical protein
MRQLASTSQAFGHKVIDQATPGEFRVRMNKFVQNKPRGWVIFLLNHRQYGTLPAQFLATIMMASNLPLKGTKTGIERDACPAR